MNNDRDTDWVTYYFENPTPNRFVDEMTRMGEAGSLALEAGDFVTLGFASKVIEDNSDLLREWFERLGVFRLRRWELLVVAAALSGDDEVDGYLEENGCPRDAFDSRPILSQNVDSGETLDMLWGHFFASGDEAPIRRIVSALDFAGDYGAAERFPESEKTEEDQSAVLRDAVFQAAMWSLKSNATQHPKVLEHCERIVRSQLTENEHTYLVLLLSELKPESYSIEVSDGEQGESGKASPATS